VLGNHDYWSDGDGVVAALTSRGVRFIHNRAIPIERSGERIYLAGLDEIYRGFPDVAATFERIPEEAPRIVVSHHPDIVDLLGEERADLLLCGHTHGGQIRFPFFGALLVPSRHEARYDMGFFRRRRLLMYVGRGIGAVPPVRILCRPELPIFDLVRA
jgi:predicted MPP superfamily phosphohydrolase